MAPSISEIISPNGSQESNHVDGINGVDRSQERKLAVYDDVHFDPKLKPKSYHIKGGFNW